MTGNNKVWRAPLAGLASVAMLATMGVAAGTASAASTEPSTAAAEYTVKFVGGTSEKTVSAFAGETIADALGGYSTGVAPSSAPGSSSKFVGWTVDGKLVDFNTVISGDVTLTARTVKNTEAVRVQYHNNDVSVAADLQFPDGADTASGYGEKYWYVEQGTSLTAQRVPQDKAGDGKLVTSWDAEGETVDDLTKVVNVTDPGDGFDIKPVTVDAKAKTLTLRAVSYGFVSGALSDGDGYTAYSKDTVTGKATVPAFVVTSGNKTVKNWVDEDNQNNGVTYAAGSEVDLAKDHTYLVVKDTTTQHVVAFDSNGGSKVDSQVVDDGGYAKLPAAPTRDGYVFAGWQYNGDTYKTQVDLNALPIKEGVTFTAVWNKTSAVKVTFEDDDYNGKHETVSVVKDANSYLTADEVPDWTREGYVFSGWTNARGTFDEDDLTSKLVADLNAGSNVTYKATWTKVSNDVAAAALNYITKNNERFTDSSWKEFEAVRDEAQKTYDKAQYDNEDASSAAYAGIVTDLNAAWKKLVFKNQDGYVEDSYRFFNKVNGEHLFTSQDAEVNALKADSNWTYEGKAFGALDADKTAGFGTLADFKTAAGKVPGVTTDDAVADLAAKLDKVADPITVGVYRLFNRANGEHLFTTDANEYDILQSRNWSAEGTVFYAPKYGSTKDVYRLFDPAKDQHLFTLDANEAQILSGKYGWSNEGVVFKAL